jgi:hypothetical protein
MAGSGRAIAQTTVPRMVQILEEEGPKTYDTRDFVDLEDSLRAWRSIGLYGGLVLVEGLLLWTILQGSVHGGPVTLAAAGMLVCLCGFLPMLLGYTELGLAFFGAGISAVVIGAAAANSSSGTNSAIVVGVLVAGVVLLAVGVARSVMTYRVLSKDE